MEVEAALIRPMLRRLFWLAAEDLLAAVKALGPDYRGMGSYCTPPELAERLLDSAFEPVFGPNGGPARGTIGRRDLRPGYDRMDSLAQYRTTITPPPGQGSRHLPAPPGADR